MFFQKKLKSTGYQKVGYISSASQAQAGLVLQVSSSSLAWPKFTSNLESGPQRHLWQGNVACSAPRAPPSRLAGACSLPCDPCKGDQLLQGFAVAGGSSSRNRHRLM